MRFGSRGFGLVDFLIALCALGLLASFIIPVYNGNENQFKYKESVATLKAVSVALEKHHLETGQYPAFESWAEIAGPENPLVSGEYIDEVPLTDSWGRPFSGKSTQTEYKIEGFSITSRSKKMVSRFPDYHFKTGGKMVKGKKEA